jgi:hypothetical protein
MGVGPAPQPNDRKLHIFHRVAPATSTRAPSRANLCAITSPVPVPAPVMIATLSFSRIFVLRARSFRILAAPMIDAHGAANRWDGPVAHGIALAVVAGGSVGLQAREQHASAVGLQPREALFSRRLTLTAISVLACDPSSDAPSF